MRENNIEPMERPPRRLRPWIIALAVVIVALIATPLLFRPPGLHQRLAGAHHGIESGELILHIETSDLGLVADFLADRGVSVPLRMIGRGREDLVLKGGRVHELGGERAAAVAYGGPGAPLVVHWIVPDRIAARLPQTGFFREGELTFMVWHEESALHVLSAAMSREALATLAKDL